VAVYRHYQHFDVFSRSSLLRFFKKKIIFIGSTNTVAYGGLHNLKLGHVILPTRAQNGVTGDIVVVIIFYRSFNFNFNLNIHPTPKEKNSQVFSLVHFEASRLLSR